MVISNRMIEMKRLVNCSQISKNFNLSASSCLLVRKVGNKYLVKTNPSEGLSFVQAFDAVKAANRLNVLNELTNF